MTKGGRSSRRFVLLLITVLLGTLVPIVPARAVAETPGAPLPVCVPGGPQPCFGRGTVYGQLTLSQTILRQGDVVTATWIAGQGGTTPIWPPQFTPEDEVQGLNNRSLVQIGDCAPGALTCSYRVAFSETCVSPFNPPAWDVFTIRVEKDNGPTVFVDAPFWLEPEKFNVALRVEDPDGVAIETTIDTLLERPPFTVTTFEGDTVIGVRRRAALGASGTQITTSIITDPSTPRIDLRAANPGLAAFFDADRFPAGASVSVPAIAHRSFNPFPNVYSGTWDQPGSNFECFRRGTWTLTVSAPGYREAAPITFTLPDPTGEAGHAQVTARLRHPLEPVADFTWTPQPPSGTVRFADASRRGSDGTGPVIEAWDWDFGDGAVGSGQAVTHQYALPGDYVVGLTVTDAEDRQGSTARTVTVGPPDLEVSIDADLDDLEIGDTVAVEIEVAASADGLGALSDLAFTDPPLRVAPGGRGTATGLTPDPTSPFTLQPGESRTFTGSVQVLEGGLITLSSRVTGLDAAGRTVSSTGSALGIVGEEPLEVTLRGAPCERERETPVFTCTVVFEDGDAGAEPTPVDVDVTAEVKNGSAATIVNDVVIDADLGLSAAGGEPLAGRLTETAGPILDGEPLSGGEIGQLLPGDSRSITYSVRATGSGTFTIEVSVTGNAQELPDGGGGEVGFAMSGFRMAGPTPVSDDAEMQLVVGDGLVVNDDGDAGDADTTDGVCDTKQDADPDTTHCTLRAALQESNARQGSGRDEQEIAFDIPGGGIPRIAPASALPDVAGTVRIDGSSQSGGWVELNGDGVDGSDGLRLTGSESEIRGLVINGFDGTPPDSRGTSEAPYAGPGSAAIVLEGEGSHIVAGNRIGTNAAGTSDASNTTGIAVWSEGNRIGGADAVTTPCSGDCNVVAGNRMQIAVYGADTEIVGNVVGLGADAASDPGSDRGENDRRTGIYVTRGGTAIGGATSTPGTAPGNIVAGDGHAIRLTGPSPGATIRGNLIGLGGSGLAYPDNHRGIHLTRGTAIVGGLLAGEGNVISGFEEYPVLEFPEFAGAGIWAEDAASSIFVEGNLIGLDPSGSAARGNDVGVRIGSFDADEAIAVRATIRGNVVSGNRHGGISSVDPSAEITGNRVGTDRAGVTPIPNLFGIASASLVGGERGAGSTACEDPCNLVSGNIGDGIAAPAVQGNFVGTDVTGLMAIPNGGIGVHSGGVVGGLAAAANGVCSGRCNLISGNGGYGVVLGGTAVDADVVGGISDVSASAQGNVIGIGLDGARLGNGRGGILVATTSASVGGVDPRSANRIAYNGGPGIALISRAGRRAHAEIRGNRIHDNAALGIDLSSGAGIGGDGATPNDSDEDSDTGPNGLQNKPLIGTAVLVDGELVLRGRFERPTDDLFELYRLELFGNDTCDASGFGEGADPLGIVTTFLAHGFWETTIGTDTTPAFITATMTDEEGNTSEFGACWPVTTGSQLVLRAQQSTTVLTVTSNAPFPVGNQIVIDPHGSAHEVRTVVGHGSLLLGEPLAFTHEVGSLVVPLGTPPDTSITAGPPPGSTSPMTGATIGFASDHEDATFECSLDGADWAACASPRTLVELGVGLHTFAVRAVLADGRFDPAPATRSWTVVPRIDTTPPVIGFTGLRTYGLLERVGVACTFADAGSGVAMSACTVPAPATGWTFGPGAEPVSGWAVDHAGNQALAEGTFSVTATFDDLCILTDQFSAKKSEKDLCNHLRHAEKDAAKGKAKQAAKHIDEYVKKVEKDRKAFTPAEIAVLVAFARTLA